MMSNYMAIIHKEPNGWHTLSISGEGFNPGRDDLLRLADDVGLSRNEADEIIEQVRAVFC